MSLNPKITDQGDKVRLDWTPDTTGQGYRLYVDGVAVSRTFKPDAKSTTFLKLDAASHRYGVQKMDVVDALEEVAWPSIPPPVALPPIITKGGIYSGQIKVNQSTPAVEVAFGNHTVNLMSRNAASLFLAGTVDEFAIYGSALSDARLDAHYDAATATAGASIFYLKA